MQTLTKFISPRNHLPRFATFFKANYTRFATFYMPYFTRFATFFKANYTRFATFSINHPLQSQVPLLSNLFHPIPINCLPVILHRNGIVALLFGYPLNHISLFKVAIFSYINKKVLKIENFFNLILYNMLIVLYLSKHHFGQIHN